MTYRETGARGIGVRRGVDATPKRRFDTDGSQSGPARGDSTPGEPIRVDPAVGVVVDPALGVVAVSPGFVEAFGADRAAPGSAIADLPGAPSRGLAADGLRDGETRAWSFLDRRNRLWSVTLSPLRALGRSETRLIALYRLEAADVDPEPPEAPDRRRLESLRVMAGAIAHDFNNILMSVLGNAELALGDLPEDSRVRGLVEEIERGARRAATLSSEMLTFSGRGRMSARAIDLNQVVRKTVRSLGAHFPEGVRTHLELDPELPELRGDPTLLTRVVVNLVDNAVDASAGGEDDRRILVRTCARVADRDDVSPADVGALAPGGLYTVLEIEDDGCGMHDDVRRRMFEPFFTTKAFGRGMGTAAVLGIVEAHRGAVRVRTAPGEGTGVSVWIPATDRRKRQAPELSDERRAPVDVRGRVLLVDDDVGVLRIGARMVERLGFAAESVDSGTAAIERLRAPGPGFDVVLLDLSMPTMDGEETFRAIRERFPDLPVILMSGFPPSHLGREWRTVGFDGFLRKPFRSETLGARLDAALRSGADPQ